MGDRWFDLLGLAAVAAIAAAAVRRPPRRRGLATLDVPPPVPVDRPMDAEHPPADFDDS